MERDFDEKSIDGEDSAAPRGKNLSPTISSLVWSKQLAARAESILSSATRFLSDLNAFSALEETASALSGRLQKFQGEVFANWCDDTEADLRDGELSMQMTGQLMEIDVDGLLSVNFSDRLAVLLREVGLLAEMGFSVPCKFATALDAEKSSTASC